MEIIIKGEAKEIAALILAVQERQAEDLGDKLARSLHQELTRRAEERRSSQESK